MFKSIQNFRTLGGVECAEGRRFLDGKVMRCAALDKASGWELDLIAERYAPKIVFDLRTEYESGMAPDKMIPGAEIVQLPMINTSGDLYKKMFPAPGDTIPPHEKIVNFICSPVSRMLADGFYISFVDDDECKRQFSKFFRTIIGYGCPNFLMHCSQGKDRTGLCAAFLLFALGAERKTVVEEYSLSAAAYTEEESFLKGLVLEAGGGEEELDIVKGLFSVNVAWFEEALDFIDSTYGSMDSYLRGQLHLSDDDMCKLKEAYSR